MYGSSYYWSFRTSSFKQVAYLILSTKGILSHSIVYIHVRVPEYISVITFLFKLHLNFWLVLYGGHFGENFPVPYYDFYCRRYWPFRGIYCLWGVLDSLWLTVLVWGRMCFSTQHNIFLKWMCTYNCCCLILTKNST